jgi:hypothetical protein
LREEHRPRVFENRVLRKIFGSKRDEVTGEWSRLHSEEFHDLYSSSNIRTGRAYRVFGGGGSQRERDHLEVIGVDGRIILKWILVKYDGGLGLD